MNKSFCYLLFALLSVPSHFLFAHTPVEFLEVLEGKPGNAIKHDVETKSVLDAAKRTVSLEGPTHFSFGVGCSDRAAKTPTAHLSWYKITDPAKQEIREVSVIDLIRGAEAKTMKVGKAEYFLTPAQRITTGPPPKVPDGLDHYTAYRIEDAKPYSLDVKLSGSVGGADRKIGKAVYLCVASEQWHHDDYSSASHSRDCFVVYELSETSGSAPLNAIDEFGLHQITTGKSSFLCVKGSLSLAN